jgi:hypothetical protein
VALILALNPGNSHNPTLSRLARELKGCELIGAESCAVAIKAIKNRMPDIVLLPAKQARGEADLIAHLKSIPGGVLTLKLPPVESADPVDLARQIREMLTGAPASGFTSFASDGLAAPKLAEAEQAEPGTSPHLLAAAAAAINWIHTRRAQWESHEPIAPVEPVAPRWEPIDPTEHYEPYEPIELKPGELYEPHELREPDEPDESREPRQPRASYAPLIKAWLPRAAALAVVIGIAGTLVSYWPRIRGAFEEFNRPREVAEPVAETPNPSVPPPTAKPEPAPDPLGKVSGWVAVFAPFDVSISEGGRGVQVDERGRAMLAPGRHRLRFQSSERGYDEIRTVDVRPADTTTVNLIPQTTIGITSNEPAEVLIDGTRVGDTPYAGKVGLGTHTVTVKTAGAERQLTVEATSKPVRLEVDFSKP